MQVFWNISHPRPESLVSIPSFEPFISLLNRLSSFPSQNAIPAYLLIDHNKKYSPSKGGCHVKETRHIANQCNLSRTSNTDSRICTDI